MWLKAERFVDKAMGWWASCLLQGTPSYILAKKLATLKVDLKWRNETEFGNIAIKKQQ